MEKTTTIEEIRRSNLRILIGETEDKTAKALALQSKTQASYLSQILTGYKLPSGKSREMGSALARKLEMSCGKPEGWMDTPHQDLINPEESEIVNLFTAMDEDMRAALLQQARLIVQLGKKQT